MTGGRDFVIKNSKKISLIILLLAVCFSLLRLNQGITGMATGGDQYIKNLERSQQSINFMVQERENCLSNLDSAQYNFNQCQSNLGSLNSNLETCTTQKEEIQKNFLACSTAKITLEDQLKTQMMAYDELAKNSVTSVCCAFSDVKSGTIKSWSIEKDSIVCSGNYTVNCTSGEITK